jgi:MFS family permease
MATPGDHHDQHRTTRSVVALLVSVFCSSAASMAQAVALGKQVYDLTHSPFDLGLIGLVEFAPAALLVFVTGPIADRFDRRRVAAIGATGEMVTAAALALYAASRPTSVTPIFLLVTAFGVARAFGTPAVRSLPADIVPADRLPWLVPRFSAAWQAASIVGPVTAGFLYAVHAWMPYAAVAVLAGLSGVTVLGVAVLESHRAGAAAASDTPAGMWHDALDGLHFIRRERVLLGAISLDLFAVLFGGAVALLPAIAEDRLHTGAVGLGWLRAAAGIGAAAVTIALAVHPVRRKVGRTLLGVVALFGVGTIGLGLTHSFAVAFVALAVLSGADSISVFIRATLVPLATPAAMRGRVLAVENVFIGASNELGAFESGVAGQVLGPSGAVVLGGVATLAIASIWWKAFPALRDVDEFSPADATALSSTIGGQFDGGGHLTS